MSEEPCFDFYYDPGSCSLAVRIVLEEGGFKYREHRVSARGPERSTNSSAWLARNPKGRVPALSPVPGSAGGQQSLLTEVPAVLTWLARLRPELDLMPRDPAREARTLEWMNWLSGWLHSVCFAQQWRPERFSAEPRAHEGIIAKGNSNMLEAFAAIESIVADGRRWAVPDAYSIADAFLMVFYRWGESSNILMESYPAWATLTFRTTQRAAVVSAFTKEGLNQLFQQSTSNELVERLGREA